jgi:quercetin dioxygenase-like cupin family protein
MIVMHDSADVRLVIFQIEPGQQVPMHTNASTVVLTVVEGSGVVNGTGGEQTVSRGAVVTYEPREPHGMRATNERFILMAAIAPRPATRQE